MASQQRDYYEILGVARNATAEEIKRAYKKVAAANHPDRNPDDPEAVERFKQAAEAFQVLGDPEKRALYDRYGHAGLKGANGGPGFRDVRDIFTSFSDIFEEMFGFGAGPRRRGPRRGASLRTAITIDLRDAARGCTRELEIQRHETCPTCHGSGAEPGTSPEPCDYCGGHGQVVRSQGFFRIQTTCPACQGQGTVVRRRCPDCRGEGRVPKSVRLEVHIPAGVDNGMQLCLRGEGESGEPGGGRGDLYVDIHVREHPLFRREGPHLACEVPITFSQAALGAEIDVPLLDGSQKLKIPAGTQSGEVFRLRGKGMPDPHGGRSGDLLVQVQVEVPKSLTPQQRELLEKLAELEHVHVSPQRKSFFEKLKDSLFPHEEHGGE